MDIGEARGALPSVLGMLLEDPANSAVVCDFDGTLAPIVADPELAEPAPGTTALLADLCGRFAVVAVVSGRPAPFLARHLGAAGPALHLFGGYGAEWIEGGELVRAPEVEPWAEQVKVVLGALRDEAPPGLGVEDKGFALALHWRRAPDVGGWAQDFAETWSARTGLALQPGRLALELRPPVGPDKGTVMASLGRGRHAACFVGDDAGDLPAFEALERLAGQGVRVVRVAVVDEESPPALIANADLVVGGPAEALAVLAALAAASSTP